MMYRNNDVKQIGSDKSFGCQAVKREALVYNTATNGISAGKHTLPILCQFLSVDNVLKLKPT